jgi:hypothetical protein
MSFPRTQYSPLIEEVNRLILPRWKMTCYFVLSVQSWIFTGSSFMASMSWRRFHSAHSHLSWKNHINAVSAASYRYMSVEHGLWRTFLTPISQRLNVVCTRGFVVLFERDLIPHSVMPAASTSLGMTFGRHIPLSEQRVRC